MNIVITGASQGIGYFTALRFAAEGHKVMAIARNARRLEGLKKESERRKDKEGIEILCSDIGDTFTIRNTITDILGRVDILINNAGALISKPFEEIGMHELKSVYETNVFAPFTLIQSLLPLFSTKAHIINISSVGGVNGTEKFPGLTAYSSSKAALSCLSECLQAEFSGKTDWTFNSLALGAVRTEMLEKAFPGYEPEITAEEMAAYIYMYSISAPPVLRGKTTIVSKTNP